MFWIFQTLNETYEEEFLVPVELRNVPSNIVITTDLPSNLHVQLRDKGSQLLSYRYTRHFKPVVVDFNAVSTGTGHVTLRGSELLRQISSQLLPGTQMLTVKPDTLDFYYNFGQCKRVPVVLQGEVRASRLFAVSNTVLKQDSVMVYASKEQLDTITGAYLQPLNLRNLSDTTQVSSGFMRSRGIKFVPEQVDLTVCVDRLVEKTVSVPVQQVNFPATKQLRTFPSSVNVTFQVAMGLYRRITRESFVIVVNYEDLLKNRSNHCTLSLKTIPAGAIHARIHPAEVEYVIEEIPESELQSENE